jgi:hypothetical protein
MGMRASRRYPLNAEGETIMPHAIPRRALLAGLLAAPARAQPAWPNRPVRFVSPFAPGGPQEIPARIIAEYLSPRLGQPVIIENRPGAGSALGTQVVARDPDGHAFLFTTTSFATLPAVMGPQAAARFVLTGDWLSAADALACGLVSEVVAFVVSTEE